MSYQFGHRGSAKLKVSKRPIPNILKSASFRCEPKGLPDSWTTGSDQWDDEKGNFPFTDEGQAINIKTGDFKRVEFSTGSLDNDGAGFGGLDPTNSPFTHVQLVRYSQNRQPGLTGIDDSSYHANCGSSEKIALQGAASGDLYSLTGNEPAVNIDFANVPGSEWVLIISAFSGDTCRLYYKGFRNLYTITSGDVTSAKSAYHFYSSQDPIQAGFLAHIPKFVSNLEIDDIINYVEGLTGLEL